MSTAEAYLDEALAQAPEGAGDVDGHLFRFEPPVRCWITPDRKVVMEFEGQVWDADTLALSISLGMEVGTWWKHARRVQRYLDAAPHLNVEEVAHQASGSAASRGYRARERPDLAHMFATDTMSRVRVGAASASDDVDLLARLARDRVSLVREAVGLSAHARVEDLVMLAGDEHPDVRGSVATNPRCPMETLTAIASSDRRMTVRDTAQRVLATMSA